MVYYNLEFHESFTLTKPYIVVAVIGELIIAGPLESKTTVSLLPPFTV